MTLRTQITLDPETHQRARRRASELRISFAEYIRRLVSRDLGRGKHKAGPSLVFNLGTSGGSDVARDKDAMVGEAVSTERRLKGKPS